MVRTWVVAAVALVTAGPAGAAESVGADRVAELVRRPRGAVLVHVWATWCPSCRAVYDDVNALPPAYGARGLTVLAFAIDDSGAAVDRYEQAHPPGWAGYHVDGGAGLAKALAAVGGRWPGSIPYDLVLDEHGDVVAQWTGGLAARDLHRVVEAALPATPPAGASLGPVVPVDQGRVRIVLAGRDGDPVWIDGWNAGVLPLDTEIVGGRHVFRVEGPQGKVEVERSVELVAAGVAIVDLAGP